MVFWSDWNRETPKIESAYMDGTNRQVVIQEGLGLPNGLTIDQEAQQLCWADAGMGLEAQKHIGLSCSPDSRGIY